MPTQCSQEELDFGTCGGRKLVGVFDGGAITSNGGAVLLGAAGHRAVRQLFRPHALAALRQIGLSDRHREERRVLRWARAKKIETLSRGPFGGRSSPAHYR